MTATPLPALLNYSKPPPGFKCSVVGGIGANAGLYMFDDGTVWHDKTGPVTPAFADGWGTEREATAAAWGHYRAHNGPPRRSPHGAPMVMEARGVDGSMMRMAVNGGSDRAAAWGWYDRRRSLALLIGQQALTWSECDVFLEKLLPWSDEECADVETFMQKSLLSEDDNFREGPECLMRAMWGSRWKPPVKPEPAAVQLDLLAPPVPMPLDYSEPPPGYSVGTGRDADPNARWFWMCDSSKAYGHRGGRSIAVAAAWDHHKAENDPPGFKGSNAEWIVGEGWRLFTAADFAKQRTQAWANYDRLREVWLMVAVIVANPEKHGPVRAVSWSEIQRWGADDLNKVGAWLSRGGHTPAVLKAA